MQKNKGAVGWMRITVSIPRLLNFVVDVRMEMRLPEQSASSGVRVVQ
jgi:hypothetical protein